MRLRSRSLGGIRDVPIAAGCARPLIGTSGSAHLQSGFDVDGDPDDGFDAGLRGLVPTAALTNIALAVRKEPRNRRAVAEVVLMGGAVAGGNRTAAAESNIVTDPEAAHIVFGERWPVTMVGLDLTQRASATPEILDRTTLGSGTGVRRAP